MLHITFSTYDCIIMHKAYYLFTCTCVSINSFHSHSHIKLCNYFHKGVRGYEATCISIHISNFTNNPVFDGLGRC